MIAFVEGSLCETGEGYVVISAGGIGYIVQTSSSDISQLPGSGSLVKMYTNLIVREDEMSLYGFLRREELEMFKMLIQVSGIGPKAAVSILSALTTDELVMAIASEDAKTIARAQGVGVRTAGRVILDLKDKIDLEAFTDNKLNSDIVSEGSGSPAGDVITALVSLGYSRSEAVRAVSAVDGFETMDSEELLKQALRKFTV